MENIDLAALNRQFLEHLGGHQHASAASLASSYPPLPRQSATATCHNSSTSPASSTSQHSANNSFSFFDSYMNSSAGVLDSSYDNSAGCSYMAIGDLVNNAAHVGNSFPPSPSESFEDQLSTDSSFDSSTEHLKLNCNQENEPRRYRRKRGANQQFVQRHAANQRERRRMQSINDAFEVCTRQCVSN